MTYVRSVCKARTEDYEATFVFQDGPPVTVIVYSPEDFAKIEQMLDRAANAAVTKEWQRMREVLAKWEKESAVCK